MLPSDKWSEVRFVSDVEGLLTSEEAEFVYDKIYAQEVVTPLSSEHIPTEGAIGQNQVHEYSEEYLKLFQNLCLDSAIAPSIKHQEWSILTTQPQFHLISAPDVNIDPGLDTESLQYSPQPPQFDLHTPPEFGDKFDEVGPQFCENRIYNPSSEVGMTCLGNHKGKLPQPFNFQGQIPFTGNCHTTGHLLDGSQVDILIDTGCTSALMPKAFYDKHTVLHTLPKYDTLVKNIVVGSGQLLPVYFALPIPLKMGEHVFECFTLIADVSNQCDFVIGLKEMFELEVLLDTQ